MQDKTADSNAIFGEPIAFIHVYTRAQAIADGVLVDVTETAREAGLDSVNQHGRSSDNHLGRFRGMNVAG